MDLKIDQDAVIELAAQKIADAVMYDGNDIASIAKKEINARIDEIFLERASVEIDAAISQAINGALDREYQRVNSWGEKEGQATTIRKELLKIADGYWGQKVDARTGKAAENSYNSVARAEFVMGQICGEKFTEQMKQAAISTTAALKDGFRAQMAGHVDKLLDELFRVKSLQDQGKATKPW